MLTGTATVAAGLDAELDDEALLKAARRLQAEQPALFGEAGGVLVMGVAAGSQAEAAGLRRGDILLRYGGEPLETVKGLIERTRQVAPQAEVGIDLLRSGRPRHLLLHGGRMGTQVRALRRTVTERMMHLNRAGEVAERRADYRAALAAWEQGLVIARREGHQKGIGVFLGNIGLAYSNLGDYPRALEHHRRALAVHREIGDRRGEGKNLTNIGVVYWNLGEYPRALEHYRQALGIFRETGDRRGEGNVLDSIAVVHDNLGDYPRALEHSSQSLAIHREIGDRRSEGANLTNIGNVYLNLGDYPRALEYFRQALAIHQEIGERRGEGTGLTNIGVVYSKLGDYPRALKHYQQALAIDREISYRRGEGDELSKIGVILSKLGDYPRALGHYRQALAIHREIGDRRGEGADLTNIGVVYSNLGDYPRALEHYRQALTIKREIGDRRGEGNNLTNIGGVYQKLGDYPRALEHYRQALGIHREIGDRREEGADLGNIGRVYKDLGDYPRALGYYRQALVIHREIVDRRSEGANLTNIGNVYLNLGDYPRALDHYRQALAIDREIDDRRGEGGDLTSIGVVYWNLGNYPRALENYGRALAIHREIGDRRGEGNDLGNIGIVYDDLGDYLRAQENYRQALAIHRELGDRHGVGAHLSNIGVAYKNLGDYPRALEQFRQALAIYREIGGRYEEGGVLLNIGLLLLVQQVTSEALSPLQQALTIQTEIGARDVLWRIWDGLRLVFADQAKPQAAILAGKQAVNTLQAMRGSNQSLDPALQQSFLSDKAHVYQGLADLLIEQGRLPEAELVLAMHKEEEFYDFIRRRSDAPDPRHTSIPCLGPERPRCQALDEAAAALRSGAEALPSAGKADATQALPTALAATLDQARSDFDAAVDALLADWGKPTDAALFAREAREQSGMLKAVLEELGHGATLVYYLIGDDKLSILVTPGADHEPFAVSVPVGRVELNRAIGELRSALRNPDCDPRPAAQVLYAHLFAPIEQRLEQVGARTLSLYLDQALRYLPLAALHDGQRYLVERYPLAIYNAAARHVLNDPRKDRWRVAALGLSGARLDFSALPGVPGELDAIVRQESPALCPPAADADHSDRPDQPDQPDPSDPPDLRGVIHGSVCLDSAFTRPALEQAIAARYPVLHIASHFKLSPGNIDDSFLLLGGDQPRLPLTDLLDRRMHFRGVDLLTLSACDTALGDGAEIEGFGTLAQNQGAKSVIATLWKVTDRSTALFMQHFYNLLANPADGQPPTKAEALRQTQLALLRGEVGTDAPDGQAVDAGTEKGSPLRLTEDSNCPNYPADPERRWDHPYYWAPFILMGNWL